MSKTNNDTTNHPTHGCANCGRKDRPQHNGICNGCSRDGMDIRVFSRTNRARCGEWMGPKDTLFHHIIGLAGEVGELCNAVKKMDREGLPGHAAPSQEDVANEVADVFIYLDLVAMHLGIDLEQAVIRKFNATSEKYGFKHRLP